MRVWLNTIYAMCGARAFSKAIQQFFSMKNEVMTVVSLLMVLVRQFIFWGVINTKQQQE